MMRRSVESAPARSQSATASALWATRQPTSAARTCPASRVGSAARSGSRSISTCPAVASLHTASVRTGRPMCDRYSRRTCAINAMLGTSTTPRSPGPDNSDMIRIDTRVLPVPHGSTSVARAASRGIQSAGLLPSQRSRCSGNPARSACTHAATTSFCMAVRGSGSVDARSRSRASARTSASAASKSMNVTSATAAASSVTALLRASATIQRSENNDAGAAPPNFCTCVVVTDPSPLRALHWIATRDPSCLMATRSMPASCDGRGAPTEVRSGHSR